MGAGAAQHSQRARQPGDASLREYGVYFPIIPPEYLFTSVMRSSAASSCSAFLAPGRVTSAWVTWSRVWATGRVTLRVMSYLSPLHSAVSLLSYLRLLGEGERLSCLWCLLGDRSGEGVTGRGARSLRNSWGSWAISIRRIVNGTNPTCDYITVTVLCSKLSV